MRNWFSRHPVSFMAFYLLFYLSAFHWLEVHIAVPDVLVHCHLDDLIPFCKYAIVPYFAWFVWIPFTLFYLLWKAPRADFWRLCVSIIASTVLLKQHSCIDVLLGILLAMALDTGMTALERSDARALQRL